MGAAVGLFTGCKDRPEGGDDHGAAQFVPEPQCVATDVEITREQMTDLGFTAHDLLAAVEGTFEAPLQYLDGETTQLHITVAHDGQPIFFRELSAPEEAPDLDCSTKSLRAGVVVTFDTDDGAFAESYPFLLEESGLPSSGKSLLVDLDTADLQGTWDPGDWTRVSFVVRVEHDGEVPVSEGELTAIRMDETDGGTECGFAWWNRAEPFTGCAE